MALGVEEMRVGYERGRGARTELPAHKLDASAIRASVQLRAAPTSCRSTTSSITRRPPQCFQAGQLLRGVWGQPGKVRVDLAPVESRLAYWGVRLAIDMLLVALPLMGGDDDSADDDWGISWIPMRSSGPPECSGVPVRSYFPMT